MAVGGPVWQQGGLCGGGVCGRGACVAGGHVWWGGIRGRWEDMHGRGHAWQGGMHGRGEGMHGRGACMAGGMCEGGACMAYDQWAVHILLECILVYVGFLVLLLQIFFVMLPFL